MSIIKEFREFFLRNASMNTGAKQDQELNFPTTHIVDGQTKYNRFLKRNIPTENVMKKFLESITFKLNVEDTAGETNHGLTKLCDVTQYGNATDNDVDGFTLTPKPSQIRDEFDTKVGDRTYTEENYVVTGQTLSQSVDALDVALAAAVAGTPAAIPTGVITMWSGAIGSIPTGWGLCDGTLGTPNLSGKFIVGYDALDADYNTIGNVGGEKEHTLILGEMPNHTHRTFDSLAGGGAEVRLAGGTIVTDSSVDNGYISTGGAGSGDPHENRPPYYTLAYIIKL